MAEADCFMLVKQYDEIGSGGLNLLDLTRVLCPRSYTTAKNYKASKKFFTYGVHSIKLKYEVEYAIMKVIEHEINCLKTVELMKQQLVSQFDYSIMQIFRMIDRFAQGQITTDNLRIFLNRYDFTVGLDDYDLGNWIRRFDKDVDGKLQFVDLVNALSTMTSY